MCGGQRWLVMEYSWGWQVIKYCITEAQSRTGVLLK
jgi:hypothetical protein